MSYKDNETNIGKKWSKEEIDDLKKELKDNTPFTQIAISHKRSEKAIELQGLNLANKFVTTKLKDKKDLDETIYGFTLKQIQQFVDFKKEQELKRKEKQKQNREKKEKLITKNESNISNYFKKDDFKNKLNVEQQMFFDKIIETNESVFLTGSPGTGKSFTLRKLIEYFKNENYNIGITSTTGCSALLVGARTLHSFLKLSINKKTAKDLYKNLLKYPEIMKTIKELQLLIIEEISMLSDKLFDTISEYLSLICENEKPFGGIKLLLVGDFCQLPPVEDKFCFLSKEWLRLNPLVMNLKTLFRQGTDVKFQQLLNRARTGSITDEDILLLKECKQQNGIEYTSLCSTNKEALTINNNKLQELIILGNEVFKYKVITKEPLLLCKGCKVMVNWNIDIQNHIVNGTTGIVETLDLNQVIIKITNSNRLYKVKYVNIKDENTGKILSTIMPLQLAWATTIHKSQGATIDYLLSNLGSTIFNDGQAYVALSRVKSLSNLALIDVKKESFKTNYYVKKFYQL